MIPKDLNTTTFTAPAQASASTPDVQRAAHGSTQGGLTLTALQNAMRDLELTVAPERIAMPATSADLRLSPPGSMTPPLVIAPENQCSAQASIASPNPSSREPSTLWLTAEGTLDINVPTAELFQRVVTAPSGQNYVDELARILCSDVYDNAGYIYESSDAYYTCEDIGRSGYDNDLDHDDLMSSSRDYIVDNVSDWMDETARSVAEQIRTRMTAGITNVEEVIRETEDHISGKFRSYSLTVMEKVAMEWYD